MATIKVKRGTRSEINTAASASGLNQGELYLITDEDVLAVGTSSSTYEDINSAGLIDLTTDVTGTLPVANGGTGVTSLGSLDAADLGSGAATDGYVLTADGSGGAAWEAVSAVSGAQTNTTNTFSANQIISVADNTNAALRITQTGTGNALVVEDSSPDSSPFVVDASGNVGIGTSSPSAKLEVAGDLIVDSTDYVKFQVLDTTNSRVPFAISSGVYATTLENDAAAAQNHEYISFSESDSSLRFGTLGTERMRIYSSGSVGIANLGTGTVYSNGGLLTNTNPSDINLKENVVPIQHGLDSINQLNPIEFDWIAEETDKHEFGFIAQEVQQVIPDLVNTYEYINEETQTTETRLGLESTQFIPVLVKALQEANAKIDALTARIEALEA